MDAKKLRIGNYVIPKYASPDVDLYIDISAEELYKMDGKVYFFEPIPLTEQWLLDFGFEYGHNDYTIDFKLYFETNDGSWSELDVLYEEKYIATIKYVHQLQNLYFALTGEELKLNK